MKNYIGISRDHSASMRSLTKAATKDYNETISSLRDASLRENIPTFVTVVKCGVGRPASVHLEHVQTNILNVEPINTYVADGSSTPLFDSVGELITNLQRVPDYYDETVSFVVMVITDGEENSSRVWNGFNLASKIKELQATDRWTFVFRVPRGYARNLTKFDIPAGNILEWDQTEEGLDYATKATSSAVSSYYKARSSGLRSTNTFYVDLSKVKVSDVKGNLTDLTNQVPSYNVGPVDKDIESFFLRYHGTYEKGCGYYQLTKSEKAIQADKNIIVYDKATNRYYGGMQARRLLGLPDTTCRVTPVGFGDFEIFIQSTSSNRKLIAGTRVLYYTL